MMSVKGKYGIKATCGYKLFNSGMVSNPLQNVACKFGVEIAHGQFHQFYKKVRYE